MANKRIDYVIGFNADTSKLSNALKQLEGQLNNIASGKTKFISDATTKDITNAKNAALELNAYLNKAINVDTGKLDDTSKHIDDLLAPEPLSNSIPFPAPY